MSKVKPGDIVHWDGADRVVIDVSGDGIAALRLPADEDSLEVVAVDADQLTPTGHI